MVKTKSFLNHFPVNCVAEKEKEKQAILAELKKVQQEKDQALMDLNSMERSLSDLFKRLDKHKEVINGHKKVSGVAWCPCLDELCSWEHVDSHLLLKMSFMYFLCHFVTPCLIIGCTRLL